MSEAISAPKFKVVEIGSRDFGRETTDYLIADDGVSAKDVMFGTAPAIAQAADRLTADVIVKSLNCFHDLLEALKDAEELLSVHFKDANPVRVSARAAIAKAEGRS